MIRRVSARTPRQIVGAALAALRRWSCAPSQSSAGKPAPTNGAPPGRRPRTRRRGLGRAPRLLMRPIPIQRGQARAHERHPPGRRPPGRRPPRTALPPTAPPTDGTPPGQRPPGRRPPDGARRRGLGRAPPLVLDGLQSSAGKPAPTKTLSTANARPTKDSRQSASPVPHVADWPPHSVPAHANPLPRAPHGRGNLSAKRCPCAPIARSQPWPSGTSSTRPHRPVSHHAAVAASANDRASAPTPTCRRGCRPGHARLRGPRASRQKVDRVLV